MNTVVLGVILAASLVLGETAVSSAEQQCLAYRRAIKQAFVRLECRSQKAGEDGQLKLRRHFEMRCWLDEPKLRTETRELAASEMAPFFTAELRCVAASVNGDVLEFSSRIADDGRAVGGSLWPADLDPNRISRELIDPRGLGVVPSLVETLNQVPFDSAVGRAGRVAAEEFDEPLHGRNCRRIVYRLADGLHTQVWLDPNREYSAVRIETTFNRDGNAYRASWETDLQQAPPHQIWFPKVVTFRQQQDGQVTIDEETTIHEVRLNEAIDNSVFTLAGMDVPTGQPFTDFRRGNGEVTRWDGRRLVSVDHPEEALVQEGNPTWLWGASMALAALAGLLVWRFWTNLRQAA